MDSLKVKTATDAKEYMNYSHWHSKFFIFSHALQKYQTLKMSQDIIPSELNIIKKNQDSDSHEFSKELLNILSGLKNYWNRRLSGKTVWDTWKNSSVFDEICRNDSSIS